MPPSLLICYNYLQSRESAIHHCYKPWSKAENRLGICMYMSLIKMSSCKNYWSNQFRMEPSVHIKLHITSCLCKAASILGTVAHIQRQRHVHVQKAHKCAADDWRALSVLMWYTEQKLLFRNCCIQSSISRSALWTCGWWINCLRIVQKIENRVWLGKVIKLVGSLLEHDVHVYTVWPRLFARFVCMCM